MRLHGKSSGRRLAGASAALLVGMAILVPMILFGCGQRGSVAARSPRAQLGAFHVGVQNRPLKPVVGDNRLVITLEDSSGHAVRGAFIEMSAVMEGMGTMPRMENRATVKEVRPGVYEAMYAISMTGEWGIHLTVRAPNGDQAVGAWRLSTSTERLTFESGTPPMGADSAPASSARADAGRGVAGFGAVMLDASRRQSIGIRTEIVTPHSLRATIRAAGRVAYDETRRAEISLKFSGWVREIRVDYTGRAVQKGEPLFTAYSPELLAAQQEFLAAQGDTELAAAARQRLLLWDIGPLQIDAIAKAGRPLEAVPIVAPGSGVVVEKNVVQGSSFTAGQVLYKIAPVHPVWVVASVYQYELPLVRTGMTAVVETPFLSERSRAGQVSYVNPYLDPATRTGEVRLTVPNSRGDLKPGMFVDVLLQRDLGRRLAVPASAVLYEGDRRIVFLDLGPAGLVPREVRLGPKAGDEYAVEDGLKAGDVIVTSGNFLIAAESKLKAASLP